MGQMINLKELLVHEIQDLYSAEEQIIEALPKMAENSANPQLKQALNRHLQVTKGQKDRLDKVKKLLNVDDPQQKGLLEKIFGAPKCKGTEGLIKEGEKLMKENMEDSVRDAAIIASAQKIEHYEISGYGTARAYAMQLGLADVEKLLTETLNEEYDADTDLTTLALFDVNLEAEQGSNGTLSGRAQAGRAAKTGK
jgi:ferritin-like metal-binding protein YciE